MEDVAVSADDEPSTNLLPTPSAKTKEERQEGLPVKRASLVVANAAPLAAHSNENKNRVKNGNRVERGAAELVLSSMIANTSSNVVSRKRTDERCVPLLLGGEEDDIMMYTQYGLIDCLYGDLGFLVV